MNNRLCTLTTVMQAILILTYSVSNKDLLENKNYITLHDSEHMCIRPISLTLRRKPDPSLHTNLHVLDELLDVPVF